MSGEYDHSEIEARMQEKWREEDLYTAPEHPQENKRYVLDMFPYPSGEGLHTGHVVGYTATDIYARYLRMHGYSVLHPMGWDAFGLPAENYAIKTGVHPHERTQKATDNFREQIKRLGLSYDWSRELNTSSPEYYQWTQWLFLLFYKHGLAHKQLASVNWCPDCQTVLANEQVVEGLCERCDAEVEQKELDQWFFNITHYADELIEGLDEVDWPESTKRAQINWIGKSEGAQLEFPLDTTARFVIVHGYAGGPEKNFVPWLAEELKKRGHEVEIPGLPNAGQPNIDEQIAYISENVTFDENTIVIGHSLGSVVALKALEAQETTVRKLVLAGGFIDTDIKTDRGYFDTFDWEFDFERIRQRARDIAIIRDMHDDAIPPEQADKLRRVTGGHIIDVKAGEPHFRSQEEPTVLTAALPALHVFTTRPDTLFGVTYMVVAPEHPLVAAYEDHTQNSDEVRAYVDAALQKTDFERTTGEKEKTGVKLEGVHVLHPATQEKLPVFVADYVLASYGTGAIMAVPAHDERDFAFAQTHDLPVVEVVSGEEELPRPSEGALINSGSFDGLEGEEAKRTITEAIGGELKTTYRLRDWLVSRQRYWGAPIPIVYDPAGNPHPIPEEHLPWELPTDVDYQPKGTAPLGSSEELKQRTEKIFGEGWTPEIDTMDTFVDSSWYFFRFTDPKNDTVFASKEHMDTWMPVDMYVGGAEHSVLHLMYARFFTKALRDLGYTEISEPFQKLRHPGTILGPDGEKMSKSKGNIVNPDDMVDRFGADTVRMYEMFMGPFDQVKAWNTDNMIGVRRFLERVVRLYGTVSDDANDQTTHVAKTTQKVGEDIANTKFNTAVSSLMVLSNTFEEIGSVSRTDFRTFLLLLAPFAPHLADHLWREMGNEGSIHAQQWPVYDPADSKDDTARVVVQVNGKVRANFDVSADITQEELEQRARADENLAKWIADKEIEKVVFVPSRLINFVTKEDTKN